MPDGKSVIYSSGATAGTAVRDLFRKSADGTGAAEQLTQNKSAGAPSSISPDGKFVVYRTGLVNEPNDLMLLPLDGSGKSRPLLADPKYNERNGEISPDGKWIAYDSNESGRIEVFVRPFPNVDGGRWQVSSEGGAYPFWARSGQELFYIGADVQRPLMRVALQPGAGFNYGKPERLFDWAPYYATTGRTIDISPDGKRFLTVKALTNSSTARPSITVVSHWFDEVRARMPAGR
jgi:dipeptidyl aminopeptidase/acylaminoacyl peptidase